jgi:hypothetical protein
MFCAELRRAVAGGAGRQKAEDKPLETVEQACAGLSRVVCLEPAFLYEIMDYSRGRRRRTVPDKGEIERFLRHVQLWPETLDIVAIRGPPALFESAEVEPAPWD